MNRRDREPAESAFAEVVNDRPHIDAVREQIVDAAARHGYDSASCFAIRLALEEAIANAFKHGHKGLPADTPVKVSYKVDPDRVEIAVEDQGPGFDPKKIPDPTKSENLELPCGRGLFLIKSYMADVQYGPKGNQLRMLYRRPPGR